jgi:hypothetical protein
MGLFGFFKKKEQFDEQEILQELKVFSRHAIDLAKPEIVRTGTFLPFGAGLNADNTLQQIIYHNPAAKTVDHREHATIIQNLIKKKYKEADCKLIMMAFDGIAHLPTGDIDAISVRVGHKPSNTHKLLTYPYKVVNRNVELQDIENPVIKKL